MNEIDEVFEFEDKPWSIQDDGAADWAVQKIKDERAERDRLLALCAEKISFYEGQARSIKERCETRTGILLARLEEYFATIDPKETKTQRKYKLISGDLVQTKAKPQMEYEDAELLEWLKTSGHREFIKTTEKPAWAEFKKGLTVDTENGIVTTPDGEVVDAVKVSEIPAKFDIK